MAQLSQLEEAPASPPQQAPISLSPELGLGFQGNPGIEVHRQGQCWGLCTQIKSVTESNNQLIISSISTSGDIAVTHILALDGATGVLTASTQLENRGDTDLSIQQCNAPSVPLPMHLTKSLVLEAAGPMSFKCNPLTVLLAPMCVKIAVGARLMTAFQG